MELTDFNKSTLETQITNKKLVSLTKKIITINSRIQRNFYEIATHLTEIDNEKLFIDDGFKNISEYANEVLGYKKSMTYALLKIGKEYTDTIKFESNLPHESQHDFSTTQIQKMLPIGDRDKVIEYIINGDITADMSCKEIEKFVKSLKEPVEGESIGEGEPLEDTGFFEEVPREETLLYTVESSIKELIDILGKETTLVNILDIATRLGLGVLTLKNE